MNLDLWNVIALWSETIFIGNIINGICTAIITDIWVRTLDSNGLGFWVDTFQYSGFMLGLAVALFNTENTKRKESFINIRHSNWKGKLGDFDVANVESPG